MGPGSLRSCAVTWIGGYVSADHKAIGGVPGRCAASLITNRELLAANRFYGV